MGVFRRSKISDQDPFSSTLGLPPALCSNRVKLNPKMSHVGEPRSALGPANPEESRSRDNASHNNTVHACSVLLDVRQARARASQI